MYAYWKIVCFLSFFALCSCQAPATNSVCFPTYTVTKVETVRLLASINHAGSTVHSSLPSLPTSVYTHGSQALAASAKDGGYCDTVPITPTVTQIVTLLESVDTAGQTITSNVGTGNVSLKPNQPSSAHPFAHPVSSKNGQAPDGVMGSSEDAFACKTGRSACPPRLESSLSSGLQPAKGAVPTAVQTKKPNAPSETRSRAEPEAASDLSKPASVVPLSDKATSNAQSIATPTVPFGVFVSTVGSNKYTLTFESTTAKSATQIIQTSGSSSSVTAIKAGDAIWVVPTRPPSFPHANTKPPWGAPPVPGRFSGNGGCLFGCGDSPPGPGGHGPPCIIFCHGSHDNPPHDQGNGKASDAQHSSTSDRSSRSSSRSSSSKCTRSSVTKDLFVTCHSSSSGASSKSCLTSIRFVSGCQLTGTTTTTVAAATPTCLLFGDMGNAKYDPSFDTDNLDDAAGKRSVGGRSGRAELAERARSKAKAKTSLKKTTTDKLGQCTLATPITKQPSSYAAGGWDAAITDKPK